jgi:hypothetical protein
MSRSQGESSARRAVVATVCAVHALCARLLFCVSLAIRAGLSSLAAAPSLGAAGKQPGLAPMGGSGARGGGDAASLGNAPSLGASRMPSSRSMPNMGGGPSNTGIAIGAGAPGRKPPAAPVAAAQPASRMSVAESFNPVPAKRAGGDLLSQVSERAARCGAACSSSSFSCALFAGR